MPRNRCTQASPHASQACTITSVSLLVRNMWPSACSSGIEFLEVVDLAVEDDDDGAVLVEQRLLAGRDVDDRQAAVAEADARLEVQAALVRAAVQLRSFIRCSTAYEMARDRECRRCLLCRTCRFKSSVLRRRQPGDAGRTGLDTRRPWRPC